MMEDDVPESIAISRLQRGHLVYYSAFSMLVESDVSRTNAGIVP